MAASLNGMAAHGGVRPFGSTFLIFTDYCEAGDPPLRADAPAGDLHRHPRLDRARRRRPDAPADRAAGDAPRHAQRDGDPPSRRHRNGRGLACGDRADPTAPRCWCSPARSSRSSIAPHSRRPTGARQGGYVLLDAPGGAPEAIVIATGSEVHVALVRSQRLQREGIASAAGFAAVVGALRGADAGVPRVGAAGAVRARVAIEAATTFGWQRWVGDDGTHRSASITSAPRLRRIDCSRSSDLPPEQVVEAVRRSFDR